jgi:hypothetical protein
MCRYWLWGANYNKVMIINESLKSAGGFVETFTQQKVSWLLTHLDVCPYLSFDTSSRRKIIIEFFLLILTVHADITLF